MRGVLVVAPDRQGGAPVAVAREGPVDVVAQPVAVAAPLDRLREPVRRLVLAQQRVLRGRGADVPGRLGVVDERGVATPAVRVGVLVGHVAQQQPARLQVAHEVGVGVLEELAAHQGDVVGERAVAAHRVDHRQAVGLADGQVVGTECRRLVHQPGAVLGGHVVGEHDDVCVGDVDQLEGTLVAPPLHLRPAEAFEHPGVLADRRRHQGLGDDRRTGQVVVLHQHVRHVGVHRDGGVGHQRPRRRRPHEQVGRVGVRAGRQREPHVDRRVDDGLVPAGLAQLVVGQAGAAARAVRRDPVVLAEQTGLVDLLERPPDALDVVGVHRAVGLRGVDPEAHPLGHLLERVDVSHHRLATAGVELRHAERLDVGLAVEPQLLLHGDLDGQAVAVPAGTPRDVVALHGAVAGEDVLEHPRLDVVGAGHPVRGRRALVEVPRRTVVTAGYRLGEHAVRAPQVENLVVERRKVDLRGKRFVAGHGGSPSCCRDRRRDEHQARCPDPRYHPPWPLGLGRSPSARPPSHHLSRGCRVYWGAGRAATCSSGDSGVISRTRAPPGLAPSPVRFRPPTWIPVPIDVEARIAALR